MNDAPAPRATCCTWTSGSPPARNESSRRRAFAAAASGPTSGWAPPGSSRSGCRRRSGPWSRGDPRRALTRAYFRAGKIVEWPMRGRLPVGHAKRMIELPVRAGAVGARLRGRPARPRGHAGGRGLGHRAQAHGDADGLAELLRLRVQSTSRDAAQRSGDGGVHGELPAPRSVHADEPGRRPAGSRTPASPRWRGCPPSPRRPSTACWSPGCSLYLECELERDRRRLRREQPGGGPHRGGGRRRACVARRRTGTTPTSSTTSRPSCT